MRPMEYASVWQMMGEKQSRERDRQGVPNRPPKAAAQMVPNAGLKALLRLLLHLNPQLLQLGLAYRSRRVHHQIHCPSRLGKWNHFAQTVGSGQNHHNTVEAQRNPAMRRCAILQCLQKESKTRARFFLGHAQRMKYFPLDVLAMNTNRA